MALTPHQSIIRRAASSPTPSSPSKTPPPTSNTPASSNSSSAEPTKSATNDIDYERLPADAPTDETDISLRAYLARQSDEHLAKYDPSWTDDQVIEWDGNFKSDGNLFLVCTERDIDVEEFRRVLEQHIEYRGNAAPK